jgi:hypothetical protein
MLLKMVTPFKMTGNKFLIIRSLSPDTGLNKRKKHGQGKNQCGKLSWKAL